MDNHESEAQASAMSDDTAHSDEERLDASPVATQVDADAGPDTPSITAVVLSLLGVVVTAAALYQALDFRGPARLAPMGIGIPLLALLIFQSVKEVVRYRRSRTPNTAVQSTPVDSAVTAQADGVPTPPMQGEVESEQGASTRALYGWFALLSFLMIGFGFYIAVPIFTFLFVRFQGRHSWLASSVHAIGSVTFLYLLMDVVFRMRVYPGYFF